MLFEPDLSASEAELLRDAQSDVVEVQARVAGHPALSRQVIEVLLQSEHAVVPHIVAQNMEIPPDVLLRLACRDTQLLDLVLMNPSCPLALVLGQVAGSLPSWQILRAATLLVPEGDATERYDALVFRMPDVQLAAIVDEVNADREVAMLAVNPFPGALKSWRSA
ncbi:hypothetical protein BJY21_000362 [Kineosphaera limosa]|uniref:Leucine rich repeat variant n=1 Tax=Kineosphaera limosa NBRC 100340 TaxID=1184609 RepID=K6WRB4_9MICO|nr:hypothetical protein [Kineosphaera limosa]NYD99177.1 hypothetical protein [Kineosphaera limosa]GAB96341.1 hypothetical protein KILIM_035_00300 [Kineosphaera limosa NBRC 100340]